MLGEIVYTTVFVSDQDRALDLYTNVLGFEQRIDKPTPDGPRFLTVGLKGGKGFGTATLDLLLEYFRGRPGVEVLTTSAAPGDGSPVTFYKRYGFERTGEVMFEEVLLREA
jgi:catechol 2,3-dioxygenase-like lactoylglutathione lyase family enzyme